MFFFGLIFIFSTTLVLLFKKEIDHHEDEPAHKKSYEENLSVKQTYKLMWQILWLAPIKKIILILMTVKVKILFFNKT